MTTKNDTGIGVIIAIGNQTKNGYYKYYKYYNIINIIEWYPFDTRKEHLSFQTTIKNILYSLKYLVEMQKQTHIYQYLFDSRNFILLVLVLRNSLLEIAIVHVTVAR